MSKGYIVIAQNNDTVDYLEQAYALALNLKLTQGNVSNLTVCVDTKTKALIQPKEYLTILLIYHGKTMPLMHSGKLITSGNIITCRLMMRQLY